VLTGGASAVYGSDAIAGVVNFIMKHDFEGVQVEQNYDFYWHNNDNNAPGDIRGAIEARHATNPSQFNLPDDDVTDGDGHEESILMGVNSSNGKGNITAYFDHRHNKAILEANRDYSACTLGAPSGHSWTCGGSGTSFPGEFTDFGVLHGADVPDNPTTPQDENPADVYALYPQCYTGADNVGALDANNNSIPDGIPDKFGCGSTYSLTGHNFRRFNAATDQYNFGPLNYYQRPDERYSFGAFGHYQVAPYADVYGSLMFTDYRTVAQIAPSGDFFNVPTVNCDNPLLSAQQEQLLCEGYIVLPDGSTVGATPIAQRAIPDTDPTTPGNQGFAPFYVGRRNVEGGGRQDDLHYQSYRVNGGVRGPISDHWSYDLNAQFARVTLSRIYHNDFSVTRLTRALDVIDADPGPGVDPECRSFVNGTDPNCVPYNVFTPTGVTKAQLDYLQVPLLQQAVTTQQMLNLAFTGDLPAITSPWAKDDMQLAFGAEYRSDSLENTTDTEFATGDGAGQGGPTIGLSGALDVLEVFMETKIPIVEDAPFMKELSFEGAYRFSHYSSGVEADTYKLAGNWSPTEDFRLRVAYQRAVRAPNIIELFSAQGFNLFDQSRDPCDATTGTVAPGCIGTAPWQVNSGQSLGGGLDSPAGQYNFLQGGNPNLQPEVADTWTYGVVLTPTFLPGFTGSVDYFDIKVINTVGAVNPQDIEDLCYNGGQASQCARIHRNPATGSLWAGGGFIESLNTNIGGLSTKGIDVNLFYRTEIAEGWGAISVNLVGTWLDELITDTGLGSKFDCEGFFGNSCGTPNPEWRHRLRVAWEVPLEDWNPELSVTWRRYSEVKLFNPDPDFLGEKFPAQNYIDVGLTATIMKGTTFRFGINNVFDKDPPLTDHTGTTGNGNTFPQTYDAFGRYVFAGVTINM
jgi:outer membrane receptor protein involved in Fe transport